MLASCPASRLNQITPALGIPFRFLSKSSRSSARFYFPVVLSEAKDFIAACQWHEILGA
jgi:hypothetical protein